MILEVKLVMSHSVLVSGLESLSEMPVGRRNVQACENTVITRGHTKRQLLSREHDIALPVLTPVACHRYPPSVAPLHLHRHDVATPTNVGHQHEVEVWVPVDGEADTPFLLARDTPVSHGHDPAFVYRELEERGLRHVEVWTGRVAPTAVIVGQRGVGRTKVCGRDNHGRMSGQAPFGIVNALQLEARAARSPGIEERGAERGRVRAVTLGVEVAVTACTP